MAKELVLPTGIGADEKSQTESYGRFTAEPFERGYGHTVGNALRRVLLGSLDGAAVTAVRIDGARHEYQTLKGVREDVMNILLNLKKLRLRLFSDGPETIYLSVKTAGSVTAAKIQENANVEVVNPELTIAHLEKGGKLDMEIEVSRGRGYVTAEEIRAQSHWPEGFIPVDALFSPVRKVHYDVENARIGQITDYDKLVLEIWTDGSLTPRDALTRAATLARKSMECFIPEEEMKKLQPEASEESASAGGDDLVGLDGKLRDMMGQNVEVIELSSRASNCLKVAKIATVRELVSRRDEDLLAVKNFGRKSLDEIKDRLKDLGLSLGMKVS